MCECGCTENDSRYTFPGPGKKLYMLTLSGGCVDCDAPSGITIERIDCKHFLLGEKEGWIDGTLPFKKWSDSEGVAIVTGLRKHQFVKLLSDHLVGVSADEMGTDGKIDESGADVILEEMYEDAMVYPHFPKAPDPGDEETTEGEDDLDPETEDKEER